MTKIPCMLVAGIMLIPVKANEKEGYFAFDTGAMQTAVNKEHFPEMKGELIHIAKFTEGMKEDAGEKGVLNTLRFSGVERLNISVLIMDLTHVENALKAVMPDLKFLGTLGIDVIKGYNVLLDYKAGEIVLDPSENFQYQMTTPMTCDKLPIISIKVNDQPCDFVLDTGANVCLLGQRFSNDPRLIPSSKAQGLFTIPKVCVGETEYENIIATVSNANAIQKIVPVEGVIGYQVLSPQRSILDFKNHQLILEKTKKDNTSTRKESSDLHKY